MTTTALLTEIRERRAEAEREWATRKDEARKDRLCVAGDVWQAMDPKGKKQRQDTMRPCQESDELNQYINQLINGVRQNPRGIQYAPTGNGANDKGAEFYENHTREIEYRSHAQMAYCTAFGDAATSSIGWLRIRRKRQHIRTFDHDLWIEPIVNADQVTCDPGAIWPDSRDMKYLFYEEPWPVTEFSKRFKTAKIRNFTPQTKSLASGWFGPNTVNVAEYWKLEAEKRRLVAYAKPGDQPMMALLDELPDGKLPEGTENIREDEIDDVRVEAYLTNGLEILKSIEWSGKHIPFVSCKGKALYVESVNGQGSELVLLSLTRLARSPAMRYLYLTTCEVEAVGGIPRSAYLGYRGQFAKPDVWAKAAHEPVPFLEAEETTERTPVGAVLPLPRKEPWDPPLQNIELAMESAKRAIQAAMGISPMPTPMQQQQQKSGKAYEKIDASAQRGSFHFNDNYDVMVERTGIILEEQIELTIDTRRDVPIREAIDGKGSIQRVNDPDDPDSIFTKGDYRVTVSTGPATESQRVEANEFVDTMVTNLGEIAQIGGPQAAKVLLAKSIKLKQLGPIGKEISELFDPPPPTGPNGKPLPPEAQALMGQLQQAQQQIQQLTQEIKTGQQGKEKLKAMDLQFDREKLASDREVKLAVAELGAKVDRMALFLQERERLGVHESSISDQLHEASEGVKNRLHDVSMHALEHHTDTVKAEQAHRHAKDLGQQGLDTQLTVQAAQPTEGGPA